MAHLGSWTWNRHTGEIRWSDELYRIFGLTPQSVPPNADVFFGAVHSEDRAKVQVRLDRTLNAHTMETISFRVVRPSGEIRYVRSDAAFLGDPRDPESAIVGTILDETDKESLATKLTHVVAELNDAQDIAGVGSWRWDKSADCLEWSEGMYRLFDMRDRPAPSEALFFAHVHPDDVERVKAASDNALATGEPGQFDLRILRDDGTVREATLRSRALLTPEGQLFGFTGILQDVTERARLERQLRHAQRMEAVSTLAGGVAHDFNNYLTVIQGHLDLLALRQADSSPLQASLGAIRHASTQCAILTQQLLTMSRKHRGALGRVSLTRLVRGMEPTIRSMLVPKIVLRLELASEASDVIADASQVDQVLMNLIINARDAMPDGGTLTLAIHEEPAHARTSEAPRRICLSVTDTGTGIPQSILPHIFEPFFTTKEVGHGTGLGLSTVYGIVQEAGGSVDVVSEAGRGSSFRVHFLAAEASAEQTSNPLRATRTRGDGKRILVVDDAEAVRQVTCALLADAGYEVLTADDGEAALTLMERETGIDAVLTDITMPKMDGRSLYWELSERQPQVPCLLITGYADERADSVPSGTQPILRKPFSAEDLLGAVARLFA
ncbi:MAG: PAS domain-containing protein [Myxococcales bacterium]